jgi:hypothetical protein
MNPNRNISTLLIIIASLVSLPGCSDLGASSFPGVGQIAGSWKLQRTTSDGGGRVTMPVAVRIDTYSKDGRYSETINGEPMYSAQYSTEEVGSGLRLRLDIDWVAGGLMLATKNPMYWIEVERDTVRLTSSDVWDSRPVVQVFSRVR